MNLILPHDDRIRLRPFQSQDTGPIYQAARESLDDLIPWMTWAHSGYQQHEMENYIRLAQKGWESGSVYAFVITDLRDETMLGTVSLNHIHPVFHFCNLGYWIRSSHRGQGLAGRAARLAARFGFEHLGLVRAEVVIAVGNRASQRVAEKMGATREGILRNRILIREDVQDAVMYSFIPADFGLNEK